MMRIEEFDGMSSSGSIPANPCDQSMYSDIDTDMMAIRQHLEEILSAYSKELQNSCVYCHCRDQPIEIHILIHSEEDDIVQAIVDRVALFKSTRPSVQDIAIMCSFSDHDVDCCIIVEHAAGLVTIRKETAYENVTYRRRA